MALASGTLSADTINVLNTVVVGSAFTGGIFGSVGDNAALGTPGATLNAITVDSVNVTGTSSVGGVAGFVRAQSMLTEIMVNNATVSGTTVVGGMLGELTDDAALDNSAIAVDSVIATVIGTGNSIGGVVGRLSIDTSITCLLYTSDAADE